MTSTITTHQAKTSRRGAGPARDSETAPVGTAGPDGTAEPNSTARSGSAPRLGLLRATSRTGSAPTRPPSVFPTGRDRTAHSAARVACIGADGPLAAQIRDHVSAAGAQLAPESDLSGCALLVVAASALPLTAPLPPRTPVLIVTAQEEVASSTWSAALALGALAVLRLPAESEQLLSLLADLTRPRSRALMLGVVAGCGGAGASSFAARLAGAARRHGTVTLVDADPRGGGLDLLVEAPDGEGATWAEIETLGPEDGAALRENLPVIDEVRLLGAGDGPGAQDVMLPRALSALAALDGTVVVDLAPGLVPSAHEHLDALLLVSRADDHAVRAAARRLRDWALPVGLAHLVVRRRGPLDARDVAEDLALPLAASFRDFSPAVVPLLDVRRRGADRAARELLDALAEEIPA